jgi:hypothetical protein
MVPRQPIRRSDVLGCHGNCAAVASLLLFSTNKDIEAFLRNA